MSNSVLTTEEHDLLRRLGLSKRAVVLYEHLLEHQSLDAKQAAKLSGELPSAEYRLFSQLEKLELIRREKKRPLVFVAMPKEVGLRAAYVQFRSGMDQLVERLSGGQGEYYLEIIVGRQALYDKYVELAAGSQSEICIYAIGIAYSKDLERSQQDALARGVAVRHVLQQIQPTNFHVAHKWQRLGVKVRYFPSERGFHLMLFDSRTLLLTFSDPEHTEDRVSILTNNPAAVRLFMTEFENIWDSSRQVNV